ncbi:MAG: endonuclease V [Methanotrichaceae archaeon]|nr:endonuclease V [Methanotrichaceae archaeon]
MESHLIKIQARIASNVVLEDQYSVEFVAGVDQAFQDELVISGAVVLDSSFKIRDLASCILRTSFPYIPGFLSFREGPAAISAVKALRTKPTLLFVDGCGINHPRMAGLASYIGVILGLPTVGISKNVLCGSFEIPTKMGQSSALIIGGEKVGYVLKTCEDCRPIVISPGHMISVESSLKVAGMFLRSHKLPEPCRLAHEYARIVKGSLPVPVQAAFP